MPSESRDKRDQSQQRDHSAQRDHQGNDGAYHGSPEPLLSLNPRRGRRVNLDERLVGIAVLPRAEVDARYGRIVGGSGPNRRYFS
jgi:hypothetical protein